MKRTDRLSKFIAILLFLAFAAYAGVYAVRALRDIGYRMYVYRSEVRPTAPR